MLNFELERTVLHLRRYDLLADPCDGFRAPECCGAALTQAEPLDLPTLDEGAQGFQNDFNWDRGIDAVLMKPNEFT